MDKKSILIGQTILYNSSPFKVAIEDAFEYSSRGGILIENGVITALGEASEIVASHPDADLHDYSRCLLLPGFVDPHVHYPQTAIIASWGERLLDWLNNYTFPEEIRFGDPAYAAGIAERYLRLVLSNGTTTVCTFCTTHPASVDAFFEVADALDLRAVAGKVCMDRNAPDELRDSAAGGSDDSRMLLEKWHGRGRLSYAITPRFALTSSRAQLEALGDLCRSYPDCLMQTHIAEQPEEVAEVARLFPDSSDYLDVYESTGLLRPNGLYGHAIYLSPRESGRLRETGAALIHCPTSNTFIGSGLFGLRERAGEGHRLGLATDTGGGSSFSMLRTMAAAYEIGQLRGSSIHPGQLVWLSTQGNAQLLNMDGCIGSLRVGNEADIVVLDLASTPAIAQRASRAEEIWEELFPTIMMGDDRAVRSVWIHGKEVLGEGKSWTPRRE